MTKLEEEILRAISDATRYKSDASPNSQLAQAKAAAAVAKKYIELEREKIWAYLRDHSTYTKDQGDVVQMQYVARAANGLKENGITE